MAKLHGNSDSRRPTWFRPAEFPSWYKRLSLNFRQNFQTDKFTDLEFRCRDGSVKAHKFIMGLASPYLGSICHDHPSEEDLVVVLPRDLSAKDVSTFVEAIYLGAVPTELGTYNAVRDIISMFELPVPYRICINDLDGLKDLTEEAAPMDEGNPGDSNDEQSATVLVVEEPNIDVIDAGNGKLTFVERQPLEVVPPEDDEDPLVVDYSRMCLFCNNLFDAHQSEANGFKCCLPECPFPKQQDTKAFANHIDRHLVTDMYREGGISCILCKKVITDHVIASDSAERTFKCCRRRCCSTDMTAAGFFEHTEHHMKPRRCPNCAEFFSSSISLQLHILSSHGAKDKEGQLKCVYETNCSLTFRTMIELKKHALKSHLGEELSPKLVVKCHKCEKKFSKVYMRQHLKLCGTNKTLVCTECGQAGFATKYTLRDHVRAKHSNERPIECEYCPAKFATMMALSWHRKDKHGRNKEGETVNKKLWQCSDCGKLLTTRVKLLAHVKAIHQGQRDFKCSYCPRTFSSKSNRTLHEGSAHTGIFPYKCDVCGKMFPKKSLLVTHQTSKCPGKTLVDQAVEVEQVENTQMIVLGEDAQLEGPAVYLI